jgi:hypothetical protein
VRVALYDTLIAGRLLDEPNARYGSFEMNTDYIFQAVDPSARDPAFLYRELSNCPVVPPRGRVSRGVE